MKQKKKANEEKGINTSKKNEYEEEKKVYKKYQ